MKKIAILIAVVALALTGWLLFRGGEGSNVEVVVDEVAELESELADLEAQVEAGALSDEEAVEARASILARLDTISAAAEAAESEELTDDQRRRLSEGLSRLRNLLTNYQATLTVIDETAGVEVAGDTQGTTASGSARARMYPGTISASLQQVIEILEEIAEQVENDESGEEGSEMEDNSDNEAEMNEGSAGEDASGGDTEGADEAGTEDESETEISTDTEAEGGVEVEMGDTEVEVDATADATTEVDSEEEAVNN